MLFNFQRVGAILVDKTTEDAVFEAAMEAGADDVAPMPEDEDGNPSSSYRVRARCIVNYQARSCWPRRCACCLINHPRMSSQVFTSVEEFGAASSKLQQLGFKVNLEESELVYRVRFKALTALLLAAHVYVE